VSNWQGRLAAGKGVDGAERHWRELGGLPALEEPLPRKKSPRRSPINSRLGCIGHHKARVKEGVRHQSSDPRPKNRQGLFDNPRLEKASVGNQGVLDRRRDKIFYYVIAL
jgi:hypothetical protein